MARSLCDRQRREPGRRHLPVANLLLSDLNGDGKLDLISPTFVRERSPRFWSVFEERATGRSLMGSSSPDPHNAGDRIVVGDFNGDGQTDVSRRRRTARSVPATETAASTLNDISSIAVPRSPPAISTAMANSITCRGLPASVHPGNGNGAFTNGANYLIGEAGLPLFVHLDGDGKLDLVAAGNELVMVMHGIGDGTFAVRFYVANLSALVIADFDGDHRSDVLAASFPGLVLLHGNGDGTLAGYRKSFLEQRYRRARFSVGLRGIAVPDFNGDGKPDVVSRNNRIIVMLNRGDADSAHPGRLPFPPDVTEPAGVRDRRREPRWPSGHRRLRLRTLDVPRQGRWHVHRRRPTDVPAYLRLQLADMNGDGKLDAVLGRWDMDGQLALGKGDGTFARADAAPGQSVADR